MPFRPTVPRAVSDLFARLPPGTQRALAIGGVGGVFVLVLAVALQPTGKPGVGVTSKGSVGQVLINGREGDDTVESLTAAVTRIQRQLMQDGKAIEVLTQALRDLGVRVSTGGSASGGTQTPGSAPARPVDFGPGEKAGTTPPPASIPAPPGAVTTPPAASSPAPPGAAPKPGQGGAGISPVSAGSAGVAVRADPGASVFRGVPAGGAIAAALAPDAVWQRPGGRQAVSVDPRVAGVMSGAPGMAPGVRLHSFTAEAAAATALTPGGASASADATPTFELGPGAILSGVLLTGLDAPTAMNARRDPVPALLRIKHETILPNRYDADQRECFVLLSGFGDLSSERAYLRTEELSCVLANGATFHERIEGYAVDETGRNGVNGPVVSRQGAFIARSLVVGIMQGVAEAFAHANQNYAVGINPSGQLSLQQYSDRTEGGAISGAGKGLDRVAEFYLQQAAAMFPVIEINAGRAIDVVLTRAVKVKLPNG